MGKRKKIIFITGTDTGVGKTLLTALLLEHLRHSGCHALAMKPFCSGGTGDVRLLQSLQAGALTDREMNPFYFRAPVAPLVAAKPGKTVQLQVAVKKIQQVTSKCACLLVEGSGGLLVPLGKGFTVADLIVKLDCQVIVVARNRLGTINHTLLTIAALERIGIRKSALQIVLMGTRNPDLSSKTNPAVLRQILKTVSMACLPYLGSNSFSKTAVQHHAAKLKRSLSALVSDY